MKCEYCDNFISTDMQRCPSCGATINISSEVQSEDMMKHNVGYMNPMYSQPLYKEQTVQPLLADCQSRVAYILLGFFLGVFGIHNFYAGYVARGVGQLLLTIVSFGCLSWISWIWSIVEIVVVTKNAKGIEFR